MLNATPTNYKVLDKNNLEVKSYTLDIRTIKDSDLCTMYDEENNITRVNFSDKNGFTTKFEWRTNGMDIKGHIKNNRLYYKGNLNGESINIVIPLEEGVPFIFNTRNALTPFILSDKESLYMYVTSSESLSAYKFEATKEGEVKLKIDEVEYDAIEVEFSMAGFIGLFMGSDLLYFDKESGKFLKRVDNRREREELIDVD